ncbi:YwaF family protein [Salirhabdus sp. Marseille-P4669]|uniref:YwaF family protein n=1 Tax=Salirhabdus sp. Marseille-P4669 TaxID=2042310 RepID=UPI001F323CDC|nr:TIGR02206 family membrane protein [Salirhabdus sp. Marseille-P4669]
MINLWNVANSFMLFSISHLVILFILTILFLFFIFFRKHLQRDKRKNVIRILLILILLVSEISLNFWYIQTGNWEITETLPLQLCTITLWLSVIMLIFRSQQLFEVLYFIGIGGAIQAIATPELFYDFPHFRYFQFFIAHIAIIFSSLYMVLLERKSVTIHSVWKSMLVLNVIAFIVFWINKALGANYMFLAHKPEQASILDFLPAYPWYILVLEFVALFVFFLLYLPFIIINHKNRSFS